MPLLKNIKSVQFQKEMTRYLLEELQPTLTARVLCGARRGYEGNDIFSKDVLLGTIDDINREREERRQRTIACIVTEGTLIGRATESGYREQVYTIEFTWSARVEQISPEAFYDDVCVYSGEIGTRLGQERMYIQFQGKTSVYKRNEEKK